jgi:hypothetical protein
MLQSAPAFRIAPIEFPDRAERSLLVCAGTGLMLSLMDACPRLRWCLDADGLTSAQQSRLAPWLVWRGYLADFVVVAGWYCATNPRPLAEAVRRLDPARLCCYVQCHGGEDPFADLRTARDLDGLISQVNAFAIQKKPRRKPPGLGCRPPRLSRGARPRRREPRTD